MSYIDLKKGLEEVVYTIYLLITQKGIPLRNFGSHLKEQHEKCNKQSTSHDILNFRSFMVAGYDNDYYLKNKKFEEEADILLNSFDLLDNLANSHKYLNPSISRMPDTKKYDKFFKHHFYDSDTKMNYAGETKNTALEIFKFHAINALKYKNEILKDKDKVLKRGFRSLNSIRLIRKYYINFGAACHYLADLNEPHHASNNIADLGRFNKVVEARFPNKIGVISNHSEFENYAFKCLKGNENIFEGLSYATYEKYKSLILNNMPEEKLKLYDKDNHLDFEEYCQMLGRESAVFAKSYIEKALSDNISEQKEAILETVQHTQIQLARFVYSFFGKY